MTRFVYIENQLYPLHDDDAIRVARRALRKARRNSTPIHETPDSVDWLRKYGPSEASVRTHHRLWLRQKYG